MADFKGLFRIIIQAAKTAFLSFGSLFIDLDTKEVILFRYFLIEFTIKSSKYALNILFWFSSIRLRTRCCSSHLDRDAFNSDFFAYLSLFFLFSLNRHVSIDFAGNKPYLF